MMVTELFICIGGEWRAVWNSTTRRKLSYKSPTIDALSQIRAFYSAWKQMLQAVKLQAQGGQTVNYVDTMWISASALTTYFLRKDAEQPTYLQEQQLAILLRAAVAINSGASGSPCTCQLFYFSLLRESVKFWSMYFSSEHTQLGPSGDPARDYYMDAIDSPQSPCSLIQESKAFLVPWQFLVLPETDQLLGDSACLPKRIVTAMVCGQYWLHKGDAKMAAALFHSASQMLVMSMDCFDNAVSGLAHHQEASNAKWLRFQELFSYLSQVDPAASPFLRPEGEARRSAISHRVPLPRLLKVPAHHGMVALPPLCLLPNSSALHLRIQGVPAEQPLFFYDFSAAWSLRRVYALPSLGGGNYTGLKAVFIGLDVPAWTNLGHALDRLISAVFGTYRYAYRSGGMPEVLRLRDTLEVHLRFSEEDSRAAGFEVNQSKGVVRSAMLPWLTLLSSRPPRLLSELPAGQVNASALPWPLQDSNIATAMVFFGKGKGKGKGNGKGKGKGKGKKGIETKGQGKANDYGMDCAFSKGSGKQLNYGMAYAYSKGFGAQYGKGKGKDSEPPHPAGVMDELSPLAPVMDELSKPQSENAVTINLLAVSGEPIPDGPEDQSPLNRINPDHTVGQICARIKDALSLDVWTQVELVHGSEKLSQTRTPSSYDITEGSLVTVVQSKIEPPPPQPRPPMMYYYVAVPVAAANHHQAMAAFQPGLMNLFAANWNAPVPVLPVQIPHQAANDPAWGLAHAQQQMAPNVYAYQRVPAQPPQAQQQAHPFLLD
ncbi:unnamed protein product [Symbiodinium natans]|uniref:Ubiquitin-like domain-containing protein n=1 Tax=Symbiodinium natans TaxID=878477 RepID=A0A812SZV0_9DINO|nr:unnamed protein product [Symbiodinium natans]